MSVVLLYLKGVLTMSLMRYDPFATALPKTMRDAMDRLLDESFAPAWRADLFAIGRGFPVDVYEDEMQYVIEASMPGVKLDELKVTATSTAITIRATTLHEEKEGKEGKAADAKDKMSGSYVRRERYTGEVTRVIDLPDLINPDKIRATYKHGVLTLDVPKAGESKPKKVDITVAE
jgi:HSP20 family protein